MALDLVDPLKDAARVISGDVRRAVFREAAEKARRRRSHNDEAEERDAPHDPPQMLPGAALLDWQPGAAARVRWAARRPDGLARVDYTSPSSCARGFILLCQYITY